MEKLILSLLDVLSIYLVVGALFSVVLVARALYKLDESTRGAGISFVLTVFVGLCIFWPVFLVKLIRKSGTKHKTQEET
jgi:hypothetical protein